jgi:hypothetical protein
VLLEASVDDGLLFLGRREPFDGRLKRVPELLEELDSLWPDQPLTGVPTASRGAPEGPATSSGPPRGGAPALR